MADPIKIDEWHAPQEKYVRWGVTGALWIAAIFAGSMLVKMVVPTVNDAFVLLQKMMENAITMTLTGLALAGVLWLAYEILSPKGKINGLFSQAYASFIRQMTMELLNVDPITPLTESLKAVRAKKREYDEQFARFDGQVQVLRHEQERFLTSAKKAETQGKAAQGLNDKAAMDRALYKAGSDRDAATNFGKMIANLERVRNVIIRLQSAADDIIYKLEIDIDSTQSQWAAAQSMSKMERAARGIMEGAGKNELARQAQALVQSKYAASIGRLNNLETAAQPLLESMDLDKATYSQEFLDKWEAEDRASSTVAIPMQATVVMPMLAPNTGGVKTPTKFSGLLDDN